MCEYCFPKEMVRQGVPFSTSEKITNMVMKLHNLTSREEILFLDLPELKFIERKKSWSQKLFIRIKDKILGRLT